MSVCILIVDDVPDNLLLLGSFLDDAGYENVDEASSARKAFELLGLEGHEKPPYDLVLLDIMMPEIDGIEATRRIKAAEHLKDIPVIMVTAKSESEDLRMAFEAGAMDYVTKPIDEVEFLARVRSALTLKREMDCRKAREAELAKSLRRIQEDISAAGDIQRSLLPGKAIKFPGIDLAWRYMPCDAVGGDLFNAFPLDEENFCFYLLDVCGHGVQAAMLAVPASKLLYERRLIRMDGSIRSPSEIISRLNQQFQMDLDTAKYFTIIYGVYNVTEKLLRYTQAGHPSPVIYIPGGGVQSSSEGDLPVGMFADSVYHTHEKHVTPGTRLFLYSDGIIEAGESELFGQDRLISLIKKGSSVSLSDCTDQIMQGMSEWLGGRSPGDDITMLALEMQ